jgi:hypothetical protein
MDRSSYTVHNTQMAKVFADPFVAEFLEPLPLTLSQPTNTLLEGGEARHFEESRRDFSTRTNSN